MHLRVRCVLNSNKKLRSNIRHDETILHHLEYAFETTYWEVQNLIAQNHAYFKSSQLKQKITSIGA